ncbi:MAG: NAD+ synthase [Planctomycetota bacterium]
MFQLPIPDLNALETALTKFIQEQVRNIAPRCLVLGISGGIDSAVVALLLHRSGLTIPTRLYWLPYRTSDPRSHEDAFLVAGQIGVKIETLDIAPVVDAAIAHWKVEDKVRVGNLCARARMMALFDASAKHGGVVVGTSNLSERYLGYGTLHGDLACAFNPIANLLKTEVRALARSIGVPESIISKPPTADLWADQTDEGELGFTYETADKILYLAFRKGMASSRISEAGIDADTVSAVLGRVERYRFKSAAVPLGPPPE